MSDEFISILNHSVDEYFELYHGNYDMAIKDIEVCLYKATNPWVIIALGYAIGELNKRKHKRDV